eukprot:COSAG04_NODE_190_length_20948_cov_7.298863_10_plen_88_part_00
MRGSGWSRPLAGVTLAVAAPPGELGEIFIAGLLLARVHTRTFRPQRLLRPVLAWPTTLRRSTLSKPEPYECSNLWCLWLRSTSGRPS